MDNNSINYTSSGFFIYNCVQGDIINITNINDNALFNNYGGLEIILI